MIFRRCFLMKKYSIAVLLLTIAAALSGVAAWWFNFVDGFGGHPPVVTVLACVTSIVLFALCYAICLINRSKAVSIVIAVYTGLIAVLWIAALIAGCFSASVDSMLPIMALFVIPYCGIAALIGNLGSILGLAFIIALFCINLYWYRKKCTSEKLSQRSLTVLFFILIAIVADLVARSVNFGYSFGVSSHEVPVLACAASVLFIALCYAVCLINRSKAVSIVIAVYTGLTAVIWIASYIFYIISLSVKPGQFLGGGGFSLLSLGNMFISPYHGIGALVGDLAGVILVLASVIALFCINLYWYKKNCT